MHEIRTSVRTAAFVIAAMFLPTGAGSGEEPGTVKVTVIGPDGKPDEKSQPLEREIGGRDEHGDRYGTKGRVVRVVVADGKGNVGTTVVHVPDGKETPVTVSMGPSVDFEDGEQKAEKGKQSGDARLHEEGYEEAKAATEHAERLVEELQQAVDAWARDNDIPAGTLSGINKQLKAARKLGGNQDPTAVSNLESYKEKLEELERWREKAAKYRKRLAALAPEKKVSGLPGACPDGQSYAFAITEDVYPAAIQSGPDRHDLVVEYAGCPAPPITLTLRPRSCPATYTCVEESASLVPEAGSKRLVAAGVIWCRITGGPWQMDFEVLLRDANGLETPAVPVQVLCQPQN